MFFKMQISCSFGFLGPLDSKPLKIYWSGARLGCPLCHLKTSGEKY